MKRLVFIILSLILTLSVSGQGRIRHVVQGGGESPSNMIANGTFDDGTGWSVNTPPWTIGGGVATSDASTSGGVSQASGDMATPLIADTNYTLTFSIVITGDADQNNLANLRIDNAALGITYVSQTGYSGSGSPHTVQFTTPSDIGAGGIGIRSSSTTVYSFTLDDVVLTAD